MSYPSARSSCINTSEPWSDHRESSWSWLAIGVLLAAWNACDDDPAPLVAPRPGVLREYPVVSRRALESSRVLQTPELAPSRPVTRI